ncbi:MbtH family protein [Streptomyces halobius]|uniref:MbtH family protein n=1 Tax=Streptomyces halobius TaxID=2879846 RepID=A0ABY4M414_9ACTN|nr:MbtH family protein [Streptomyces halobius]UQA92484.1 MbtH family protein [Streptomyces halobius]
MSNPFENNDGTYLVLVNEEGQHSIWPNFIDVPAGWSIAHGEDSREACLAYVEQNWKDIRPNSSLPTTETSGV